MAGASAAAQEATAAVVTPRSDHNDAAPPVSPRAWLGQPPASSAASFYRRELPSPPAVAFSSPQGKVMFGEALADGTMEGFFPLIEHFQTQDEPAFCGLASLAMVLNTLRIDPRRPWKGPWRYFHEQLLDCCAPLSEVVTKGIVLDQAACLARCNGARVDVFRQPDISLADFRQEVIRVTRSSLEHMIVSYSRKAFLQTGDGHFSPIGGYHTGSDHALILDVARFKYAPHWVSLPLLHKAMGFEDAVTGKPRGLLIVGHTLQPSSVLFTLDLRSRDWRGAMECMQQMGEASRGAGSGDNAAAALLEGAPLQAIAEFVSVRQGDVCCTADQPSCMQPEATKLLLAELQQMPLVRHVQKFCLKVARMPETPYLAERLTMYLLMAFATTPAQGDVRSLFSMNQSHQVLRAELDYLLSQCAQLPALQKVHDLQTRACTGSNGARNST